MVDDRPVPRRIPRLAIDASVAIWFAVISATLAFGPAFKGQEVRLGWDAIVYSHAAQALLAGSDPWAVEIFGIHFAAPPPSLLPFVPFAWLPDIAVAAAWVAIALVSSIYAVRTLRLPWFWLLFPPIVLGVLAGSSAPLVLALLVRGGVAADAAAVVARVFAAAPLLVLGRWRGLVAAAVVAFVTLTFLAWPRFLDALPAIAATLSSQASGGLSAVVQPLTLVIAVVSLVLLGRRRAAWLAVPALWPATQLYYASIALPVLGEMPLVAIAIASAGTPGLIAFGLAGQVLIDRLMPRLRRLPWVGEVERPAPRAAPALPPSEAPD
jgi:hypothetical protein